MRSMWSWLAALAAVGCGALLSNGQPKAKPEVAQAERAKARAPANDRDWIDPFTGHRVVRLSEEPGSATLYFHDNSYTPEGDKLIFNTPSGVAAVEVAKIGTSAQKMEIVTKGGGSKFARRTREVYVQRGGGIGREMPAAQPQPGGQAAAQATPPQAGFGGSDGRGSFRGGPVYAVNIDSKQERLIPNAVSTVVSCDETWGFVVARGVEDPTGNTPRPPFREPVPQLQRMFPGKKLEDLTPDQQYSVQKEERLARNAVNPGPAAYTFINLKTGERRTAGYQYGNLNHQQWNPVIPDLLLYAHEGTWHEVERTWTIRADGSGMKLMHKRTMDMEINGHEWWSFDGKIVWFDLQTPRSEDFWIAGVNIETMKETRYHVTRDTWGVHFNSSRDNTMFVSDGGDPSQVSYSTNGMWMNLFRAQPNGTVRHERLADMSKHNYVTGARGGVEPNASITPDKKWVIFTGQFANGQRHVYAVSVAKAK